MLALPRKQKWTKSWRQRVFRVLILGARLLSRSASSGAKFTGARLSSKLKVWAVRATTTTRTLRLMSTMRAVCVKCLQTGITTSLSTEVNALLIGVRTAPPPSPMTRLNTWKKMDIYGICAILWRTQAQMSRILW